MKRKGFTIIELALAIVLFSFGVISVMQIFPVNRRLLTQSSMQTMAANLAQEQIENVRNLSYASLTTGSYEPKAYLTGSTGDPVTQFQRSTDISLIDSNYNSTATDVGLKKIVVTVYWSEGSVNRTYAITTYANNL